MKQRLGLLVGLGGLLGLVFLMAPRWASAQGGGDSGVMPAATCPNPAAGSPFLVDYQNLYDGTPQQARAQLPTSYDGTPRPLLVAVHARNGNMFFGESTFGAEANTRGWLLVSPQLHGRAVIAPDPPGAYAYASVESQYDIYYAVSYMLDCYQVDTSRIYLAGYSMGSQTALVAAAKFPDLFAAIFANKGPTDMVTWYDEQAAWMGADKEPVKYMRRECHIDGVQKLPDENPFCYQRRSSLNMATNLTRMPIAITHTSLDHVVPVTHAYRLRGAITSLGPLYPVSLSVNDGSTLVNQCPDDYHCYVPNAADVLNFLQGYTLANNPTTINITTDMSKPYYWLKINQSGGDHWSQVQASYNQAGRRVTAVVSDTQSLTLGFNLGSTPTHNPIPIPGLGLPTPMTYLVDGPAGKSLADYTGGYLNLNLPGQASVSLTAITVNIAISTTIVAPGGSTSLVVTVRDWLGNPVPAGTLVDLLTNRGDILGANTRYTDSAGQTPQVTFKAGSGGGQALITARVGQVSQSVTVGEADRLLYLPGLAR